VTWRVHSLSNTAMDGWILQTDRYIHTYTPYIQYTHRQTNLFYFYLFT